MFDLKKWFDDRQDRKLIISGPCSAETEEQVLATARELTMVPEMCVFRAGVWKPRTSPDGFQGRGKEALIWLNEVRRRYDIPVMVEVATPEHIELCLQNNIDAVWIGARTVVNPFSVQQLADALRGTDMPVFVKNPVTPDLKLWIGSFERFAKKGTTRMAAIHRGFHHFTEQPYRNFPMWELPMELERLIGLPIITDVSHICGCRDLLLPVAQKAADMASSGLMIETHISPDNALTDAKQQITPQQLATLLDSVVWRKPTSATNATPLIGLRAEIDDIDAEILRLLAHRMDISRKIGELKKSQGLSAYQPERWKNVLDEHIKAGQTLGIDDELVTDVFESIHKASVNVQTEILGNPAKENHETQL